MSEYKPGSAIIKEIIDSYTNEKMLYMGFIREKKLAGEFLKWIAEQEAKHKELTDALDK